MTGLFVIVALAVVGAAAVAASGRLDRLPPAEPDVAPAGSLDAPRFDVVARGYRMDEVDETIQALQAEIASLRGDSQAG